MKTENVEMESLLRSEAQALHNQLILYLSTTPDQVIKQSHVNVFYLYAVNNTVCICICVGFERTKVAGKCHF